MNWTSARILILLCVLVATGVSASPATARGSVGGLLDDASDGVVDGSYNPAQVREALTTVRSDPAYMQYSDIEGVLVDYQASLTGGLPSPLRRRGPAPRTHPQVRGRLPVTRARPARQRRRATRLRREGRATRRTREGSLRTGVPCPA